MEQLHKIKAIQKAIIQKQYSVYYQPKIEKQTRKIIGAEALMRLKVEADIVSPFEFINEVIRLGKMAEMQAYLIKEVVAKLNSETFIHKEFSISVNINAEDLVNERYIEGIIKELKKELLNPSQLELEITEKKEIVDLMKAQKNVTKLKELAIKLSLDDFGKGYSSLAYLKAFPIDTLKIDQSFVQEALDSWKTQEIIRAIIQLSHNLNIQVVAEGVETIEQLKFLDDLDCDIYQGFYFDAAIPFNQLKEKWLEDKEGNSLIN